MATVNTPNIRFKQSVAADVVKNRVYVHAPNTPFAKTNPFVDVPKPVAGADGYSLISVALVSQLTGVEGRRDIDVTAIDGVGNESDPLELDNQLFDLSPPAAPTDGSIV